MVTSLFPFYFSFPPLFPSFPHFSFPLSPPLPDRVARAQSLTWSEGQPIKLVFFFFLISSFFTWLSFELLNTRFLMGINSQTLAVFMPLEGSKELEWLGFVHLWTQFLKIKKSGVCDPPKDTNRKKWLWNLIKEFLWGTLDISDILEVNMLLCQMINQQPSFLLSSGGLSYHLALASYCPQIFIPR